MHLLIRESLFLRQVLLLADAVEVMVDRVVQIPGDDIEEDDVAVVLVVKGIVQRVGFLVRFRGGVPAFRGRRGAGRDKRHKQREHARARGGS